MQGLFLGAGASYELGMPLVWELTKVLARDHIPATLRRMQSNQHAGSTMHWSEDSVEHLISLLSDNELHYEAVIGAIEVEAQRRLGPQESYERIRLHLVDMVSRYLIDQHNHEKNSPSQRFPIQPGLPNLLKTTSHSTYSALTMT
nr:hypothetical protein [Pseudomonas oleovorans]